MRHQSAIVTKDTAPDELVRLRHLVQGTLATARALGSIDDDEFQRISNQTIEAMEPEVMLRLSELAYEAYQMLWREAQSRVGFASP
jgi:uncharacterized membrane protein YebE (DUF533 family)